MLMPKFALKQTIQKRMKTKFLKSLATLLCASALLISVNTKAQWVAMGTGITGGTVSTMASFNSKLYIGGGFFSPYSDMTTWNGGSYSSGLVAMSQPPLAMCTFDSVLYIATYNAIYQLIGSTSTQIANLNDPCYAICFYNHKLYAGGWMDSVGLGASGKRAFTGYMAVYDGVKWDSIQGKVDSWPKAMCLYNGKLAVVGYMNYSSVKDTLYGAALYDGSKWTRLNFGVKGASGAPYAVAAVGSDLYVGGGFDSASTNATVYNPHVRTKNIAVWTGTTWDSVGKGNSGTVYALASFNGGLVSGGYFDSVMYWSGSAWSSLGALSSAAEINA